MKHTSRFCYNAITNAITNAKTTAITTAKTCVKTKVIRWTLWIPVLFASSMAHAGELDDISIQIIGLDQVPNEALQEIPLPTPATGSAGITDMQGDVIFNKPLASPGTGLIDAIGDNGSPAAAPVAGGGTSGTPSGP